MATHAGIVLLQTIRQIMTTPHFLEAWHDFFVLAGTASATLVGLLFVALSLNKDSIAQQPIFRSIGRQTVLALMSVLVVSLLGLLPPAQFSARSLGACVFAFSLCNLVPSLFIHARTVRQHRQHNAAPSTDGERETARRHERIYIGKALVYNAAILLSAGSGAWLWRGEESAILLLVPVIFVLGGRAIVNSWELVVRVD